MSTSSTSGNPLDAIKAKNAAAAAASEEGTTFRVFKSARPSVRLITESGFRITFTGYKYITQNEEAIDYLERCIKARVPGITDDGSITSDELNPETAMRAKYYAEFLAEQKALQDPNRDMGTTEGASKIKVASTADQPK